MKIKEGTLHHQLLFFLWYALFWLICFEVQRAVFLLFFLNDLKDIQYYEIVLSFWYGLGMDISTISYVLVIPFIMVCIGLLVERSKVFQSIVSVYTSLLILFNLFLGFLDVGLYKSWGSKFNAKVLSFVSEGKENVSLIFSSQNMVYIILFIFFLAIQLFVYLSYIRSRREYNIRRWVSLLILVVGLGILFLGIRGGFGKFPVNKRWVYYSKYPVLNNAALNSFWNFGQILIEPPDKENPYTYFSKDSAEAIVRELYAQEIDTISDVLSTSRPNIVLVLLESMSADAISVLGGEEGICPGIDSLSKDGLLFTQCYATGFRTDQGIVSYLSGFPALPASTMLKNFGKFDKLPNLIRALSDSSYYTSYYFGGNYSYMNTDTYLISSGIDKISGENDFEWKRRTDWGAYDEDLFTFHANDLENLPEPFFSIIITITNHEYFDANVEKVFNNGDEADNYRNTAHYTDHCLYEYIKLASTKDWYKNTLFVITADHAHSFPKNRKYNEPGRHHIPLLLYGEVLKPEFRGTSRDAICSQLDLSILILDQLGIDRTAFHWSKDPLGHRPPSFAFYTFDNGFGLITGEGFVVWDQNLSQVVLESEGITKEQRTHVLNQAKAYMQVMYNEFLGL